MIIKIRKMLLCALLIQLLFISLSFVSHAASCSNRWSGPSSQTMETEIMSATETLYANGERYLSIKQGWKTTHIYFLRGALLVKGPDDSEINFDNIFWLPTMFTQSGVLSKAFPQGPCSMTQKTTIALNEAEGEVVPTSQGVINYNYTLTGKQNVKHFKGVMKFTPPETAPSDNIVVKDFKLVGRTKPYPVVGSKDMLVTNLGELRHALDAKKTPKRREIDQAVSDLFTGKDSTKDTMKPEDIIMAPQQTTDSKNGNELYPLQIGSLWGYVNRVGRVTIAPRFHLAFFFESGVARVHINHQWGIIDKTGKFIVDPQYEAIGHLRDGLACVRKNGKIGYINESGKIIVPIEGDCGIMPEYEKGVVAFVDRKDKSYYFDMSGNGITKEQFREARQYKARKTSYPVQKDGKWGLVNSNNELTLKPEYDHINDAKEGFFLVKKNGLYGFIDQTGNLIIDLHFEHAYDFKDGLAGVKKNGKYGFIDKMGRFVINPKFDLVRPFEDGIACIQIDKKWGLIDKTGHYIAEPQFETGPLGLKPVSFDHGVGTIQKNNNWGLIDRTGKVLIEPQFDKGPTFLGTCEYAIVEKNFKQGVIHKSGKIIISPQYTSIINYPSFAQPDARNVFQVIKYPHNGYADISGNVFVMTDKVCGQYVVKNNKGEITWPRNIKELCGKSN